eukprot:PhF_6_TR43355/c2_g1_i3/m.66427
MCQPRYRVNDLGTPTTTTLQAHRALQVRNVSSPLPSWPDIVRYDDNVKSLNVRSHRSKTLSLESNVRNVRLFALQRNYVVRQMPSSRPTTGRKQPRHGSKGSGNGKFKKRHSNIKS